MSSSFIRRISIALLAALAFMHASVVLADCDMERGQAMQSALCIAHCTSDLQAVAFPVALVDTSGGALVLVVPAPEPRDALNRACETPPPIAVPPRILFQSFLN